MHNAHIFSAGMVVTGFFLAGCAARTSSPSADVPSAAVARKEVSARPAIVPAPPPTPVERMRAEAARRDAESASAKAAASREPLNWRVFNELGMVYYRHAMYDQAIAAFQQAIALHSVTTVIETESKQEAAIAAQRAALAQRREADIQRAKEQQAQQEMNDLFGLLVGAANANGNSSLATLAPVMESLNNQALTSPSDVPPLAPGVKSESSLKAKREVANIYASLGAAYFGKTSYQQALASFDNVIQLDPSRTDVLKESAEAQYHLCKYDECIATLTKYHAIAPVEAASLMRLSDAYRALGMQTEAARVLESFLAKQDGSPADCGQLMAIGALCLSHWQYEEASKFLTRAREICGDSPDKGRRAGEAIVGKAQMAHGISLLLAEAQLGLGQTTKAIALLQDATQDKANPKVWYMLARCYDEIEDREKAAEAYGKALEAFGAVDAPALALADNYIQVSRAATGKGDEAIRVLEKRLGSVPLTPGGGVEQWCAMAFAYEKSGRIAEAMEILNRCREATPAYTKAGLALDRLGKQVATDRNRILGEADAALQSGDKNQAIKKLADAYRLTVAGEKREDIRKTLLKLGVGMDPPVGMTSEAQDHYLRGTAALKAAKTPMDLGRSLSEFQWAIFCSPWVGDLYFNTSAVKNLQNQNAAAVSDLKLYLTGKPGSINVDETLSRLYELEYHREQKLRELAYAAAY
jgi:tetratricopeptide (TPR) repeat protein